MFASHTTLAQKVLQGVVIESVTKTPLAYVNVGVKNRAIGTVSDRKGFFRLTIPSELQSDTLFLSSVGYAEVKIPIANLKRNDSLRVELSEKATQLEDFVLKANTKRRYSQLGVKRKSNIAMHTPKFYEGAQIARLISVKDYPVFISKVSLGIHSNDLESLYIRIRVMKKDISTGEPGEDLLEKEVIKNIGYETGWVEVDLENYQLRVENDFFVSIEFLEPPNHGNQSFMMYVKQPKKWELKNVQYIRLGSYGEWVPRSNSGMNFLTYAIGTTVYSVR